MMGKAKTWSVGEDCRVGSAIVAEGAEGRWGK